MHTRFIALILVVLGSTPAFGSKYAGDFQELGVGAQALAMGSAYVAASADPFCLYWNPSGTALLDRRAVCFMHADNFGGIVNNEYLSFSVPSTTGAVGIAYYYLGVPDIKLTRLPDTLHDLSETNRPIPYDTVGASDHLLFLNYSRGRGRFSYGANLKLYYRNLAVLKGFGGGVDAGVQFHLGALDVGMVMRDVILSPIIWDDGSRDEILPRVAVGLAQTLPIDAWRSEVRLEWDLVKRVDNGRSFEQNLGGEFSYRKSVFMRLGLRELRPCLGLGIRWRSFSIDYAFVHHPELSSSNKISAGVAF